MQIGRNDDQAIQLDFGDTGISRSNHAVIAYDPEDRKCYLGHGGKANLVRLNGKPVLSTVALSNGDLIRISETSIRFMAFCDEGFDWRDS
jgi:pSer/pThr/pTyr-binding forkhead associated (FHA) protein